MARHKVLISGVNTADIKVLNSSENEALFRKMKEGDPFARNDLVEGNLKLVLSILKKFSHRNENMDDLFQVGCVGLVKAIDNFDVDYGLQLSTYACPMILGEIKRYLRDNGSMRISRSTKDLAYKVIAEKEKWYKEHGTEASLEEIAKKLEVTTFEAVSAITSLKDPVSIFEPIYNDGGDTIYLFDQLEDKRSSNDTDTKLAINDAIDNLSEREKHILDERFVIGKTQTEIAEELTISQAQVSRLEKSAINQLKKILK